MQPFDALTMQAVLLEAKPLLVNRRVDDVQQCGRDELLVSFRGKTGLTELLLSAHATYGRLCLVKSVTGKKGQEKGADKGGASKSAGKGNDQRSGFIALLKRHLTSATLVGIEQLSAERVVDFVFSSTNEVGTASLKVLTAEIMGRHSNLVFWNHADKTIIAASHLVTKDMSRHREILLGAKYVRPPVQEKPNVFQVPEAEFLKALAGWVTEHQVSLPAGATALESFLLSVYSGLGRNLAHEIVVAALQSHERNVDAGNLENVDVTSITHEQNGDNDGRAIWQVISRIAQAPVFRPAVKKDLSRYTILSLDADSRNLDEWRVLPAVNDLVDDYYRTAAMIDTFRQTRERMLSDARAEVVRLETRLKSAVDQILSPSEIEQSKLFGDLILANLNEIKPGQDSIVCENVFADPPVPITIALNNNLTASQNAQFFYRQFAKSRSRERAASLAQIEADDRLKQANRQLELVEQAKTIEELQGLRKEVVEIKQMQQAKPQSNRNSPVVPQNRQKAKTKLLTINSSDGWSICVGRNRHENDFLLSRIAQPQDFWLHILGQSGAHVLVRVPNNKQEPPLTTIREAAQIAARFSKTPPNTKVRVVYTQCRYVKKVASGKPGVVRYENEKTIEVDTTTGIPEAVKKVLAGPRVN